MHQNPDVLLMDLVECSLIGKVLPYYLKKFLKRFQKILTGNVGSNFSISIFKFDEINIT